MPTEAFRRPVLLPDNKTEHAEGGPECTSYKLSVTAELFNEILVRAYGHGVTVDMGQPDAEGFYTPTVTENIESSLTPTAEVVRQMLMEDLLQRWYVLSNVLGVKPQTAGIRTHLAQETRDVLRPFNIAEVAKGMVRPIPSHEDD